LENPPYNELAIVVLLITRKVIVLYVIATMQSSTKLEVDGCCSCRVYTYKPKTLYIIILQTFKKFAYSPHISNDKTLANPSLTHVSKYKIVIDVEKCFINIPFIL